MGFSDLSRMHGFKISPNALCSLEDCSLAVGEVVGYSSIMSASRMNGAVVIFVCWGWAYPAAAEECSSSEEGLMEEEDTVCKTALLKRKQGSQSQSPVRRRRSRQRQSLVRRRRWRMVPQTVSLSQTHQCFLLLSRKSCTQYKVYKCSFKKPKIWKMSILQTKNAQVSDEHERSSLSKKFTDWKKLLWDSNKSLAMKTECL